MGRGSRVFHAKHASAAWLRRPSTFLVLVGGRGGEQKSEHGTNQSRNPHLDSMMSHGHAGRLAAIYIYIYIIGMFGNLAATFTADGLRRTLPGPASPGVGDRPRHTPLAFDGGQQRSSKPSPSPSTYTLTKKQHGERSVPHVSAIIFPPT